MCVFCAAVPAAVSLGAAMHVKQAQARQETTESEARPASALVKIPARPVTAVIVGALVTGSVIYHSRLGPL